MDLRAAFGLLAVAVLAAVSGAGCSREVTTTLPTPTPNQGAPPQTRALTLSGQVFQLSDGVRKPVGGAEVDWCDSAKCPHGQPVVTDEHGRYVINAQAWGAASVRAEKSGYRIGYSTWFADGGAVTADVEVTLRNVLTILVIESTTGGVRPLPGAEVSLCWYPECGGAWDSRYTTGDDGQIAVEFNDAVSYFVRIRKSGFRDYWPETAVTVVGAVSFTVELTR